MREIGRSGGIRTSETHGEEFYSEIGRKGGKIGAMVRKRNKEVGIKPVPKTSKKPMTPQEAGAKGGQKTAFTHGREFYEEIGRKGGEKVSAERGQKFYSEIGSKGGSLRAMQHEGSVEAEGKTSLEEAGHRGGQRVRRLIQLGKEKENEY